MSKYSRATRLMTICAALLALHGCGASDDGERGSGVSADEARALNEAAAMLDERAAAVRPAIEGNASD